MTDADQRDLRSLRRRLHEHPEPAWREYITTATIIEELQDRPLTELDYGAEVLSSERVNVPPPDELADWQDNALDAGVSETLLDEMEGGYTGAIAVRELGDGPTVGLRVDIDGLPITEAAQNHEPAAGGFRSEHEGYMHACGHDAHAAIGIGVLDALDEADFDGSLKLFFQPAEERGSGAKPMVESGHADDLDYFLAVHVGLDHPTGEIVAGIDGFLAIRDFVAEFSGESAHAGADPEKGRNALLAAAEAATNIHAIPRHSDGLSRVNIGTIEGGTAPNIIAESATLQGQVRGETTEIMEYMSTEAERRLQAAADMYDVDLTIPDDEGTIAPSATSDAEIVDRIVELAPDVAGVERVRRRDTLDGSEDATHFMRHVQHQGGKACYVCIGTDHPDGHHTPHFDVDEESIAIGVDVVAGAIEAIGSDHE